MALSIVSDFKDLGAGVSDGWVLEDLCFLTQLTSDFGSVLLVPRLVSALLLTSGLLMSCILCQGFGFHFLFHPYPNP